MVIPSQRGERIAKDGSRELRAEINLSPIGHALRCLASSGFRMELLFHGPIRAALIASPTQLGMRHATRLLYH